MLLAGSKTIIIFALFTNSLAMERIILDFDPAGLVYTGLDVDDDLAFITALALNMSAAIDLAGVTVCGGNAPLRHTWDDALALLRHCGLSSGNFSLKLSVDWPAKGAGWHDMYVAWNSLLTLHTLSPDEKSASAAVEAIIEAVRSNPQRTITVVALGPPTNLANALRQAPDIALLLRRVVLMGGALDGKRLDLNWMSDRAAARRVVEAPVPKILVPIQTCAQTVMRESDIDKFEGACCPRAAACALLPKMRLQVRVMPTMVNRYVTSRFDANSRWTPHKGLSSQPSFIPWDVVALFALARPELFAEWERISVAVGPCDSGEPCSGNMRVVAEDSRFLKISNIAAEFASDGEVIGASTSPRDQHRGVVRVPHRVLDGDALVQQAMDLMCTVRAADDVPNMQAGFLPVILGSMLLVMLFFWSLFVRFCRARVKVKFV